MHKLLIDINVILDTALSRDPHDVSATKLLSYIEDKKAEGYLSAISHSIIFYLIQKDCDAKIARSYIKDLLRLLKVVEVNYDILDLSVDMLSTDFEDNIQIASAEFCKANYIITRNKSDFKKSIVLPLSPAEYIATFNI